MRIYKYTWLHEKQVLLYLDMWFVLFCFGLFPTTTGYVEIATKTFPKNAYILHKFL